MDTTKTKQAIKGGEFLIREKGNDLLPVLVRVEHLFAYDIIYLNTAH